MTRPRPVIAPLAAALLSGVPAMARTQVCADLSGGGPATALTEAFWLAGSLPAVVLLVVTVAALRFRSAWGGLGAVTGWSILVGLIVFAPGSDPTGMGRAARAEDCVGSPALFIACVAAICVATILYTAPASGGAADKDS